MVERWYGLRRLLVFGLHSLLHLAYITLVLVTAWPWPGEAAQPPVALQTAVAAGLVALGEGESLVLQVTDAVRVAVAEPKVADVAVMGRNEVLVSARMAGETTLHVWDKNGLSSFSIRVLENKSNLVSELKNRIGLAGVEPWMHQDTVVLEGFVQTAAERQRALQVAAAYGSKVIDLLSLRQDQLTGETADGNHTAELAAVNALIAEPTVQLRVVNGTLLVTGEVADAAAQERIRKVAGLYFPQVVDATKVTAPGTSMENGHWPVEIFRVVEKDVVQVQM